MLLSRAGNRLERSHSFSILASTLFQLRKGECCESFESEFSGGGEGGVRVDFRVFLWNQFLCLNNRCRRFTDFHYYYYCYYYKVVGTSAVRSNLCTTPQVVPSTALRGWGGLERGGESQRTQCPKNPLLRSSQLQDNSSSYENSAPPPCMST